MEAVQILQMLITTKGDRLLHFKRASCNTSSEEAGQVVVGVGGLPGRGRGSCVSWPTLVAAEVRQSHVLQRDLLQEAGTLAAGVARHDLPAPQPIAEPGQTAVAVEGVRQEVAWFGKQRESVRRPLNTHTHVRREGLTGWRGPEACRRLRG